MAATTTILNQYYRGNNLYSEIKVSIPSADVLTLFSIPITAIAAPGSGYAILITEYFQRISTYGGTPYATHTTVNLIYGSAGTTINAIITALAASAVGIQLASNQTAVGSATTLIENDSVVIKAGAGDPTAGNSNIEIFIGYEIIKLN